MPLGDEMEQCFASEAVRRPVEELQADDLAKLTTRRRGKRLVLGVGARTWPSSRGSKAAAPHLGPTVISLSGLFLSFPVPLGTT